MLVMRNRNYILTVTRIAAIATGMLMLTVLIVSKSQAAFTDTTDNPGNGFSSASVVLTDDDTGSAMYAATGMTPGNPLVECIEVTYSGTAVPANIRMYGTSSGALASYLDMTIEVGTGGTSASCTGFSSTTTIYSGTLSNFSSTRTNWTSGLATFTAASNPTVRTLRFTVDVQNDDLAQNKSATASLTWEAQE